MRLDICLACCHEDRVIHGGPEADVTDARQGGDWDGRRAEYWLGSHRYLEERAQETPAVHEELERLSAAGRSVIIVGNDDHLCGMLATADDLRPEATSAVVALKWAGISWVAGRQPRCA